MLVVIEVNHPRTPSLSTTCECPADFAYATRSLNNITGNWMGGKIFQKFVFFFR